MRRTAVLGLAALLLAGCGGGKEGRSAATTGASSPGTLRSILARPGPDVAFLPGTSDYGVGEVRVSFLVVRGDGQAVSKPTARFWVGRSLDEAPIATGTATLEPIGIPGKSKAAAGDVHEIYIARFRVTAPGRYYLVAEPEGGQIQAYRDLDVKQHPVAPAVGDKAIPSHTPTLASAPIDALTTADPPDRDLLKVSVADAIKAHEPFVVAFATPKYCTSRTCGPVVDVLDAVRKRFARDGVQFIHVEIYEGNDPSNGPNRWVKEWRLPSEPFVFLVGRDGLIKARYEGSVSVAELSAAVSRFLV